MREWCEYAAVWTILKFLGILPRPAARAFAAMVARMLLICLPRLRGTAMENLRLAFPEWTDARRGEVIHGVTRNLGWMAAEFARFPKLSRENIGELVVVDGFENFEKAREQGKGVIFLTGHMSAWELAPFAQALYGYPLSFLARAIDNERVNRLVDSYRCLSGNRPIEKNNAARAALRVLHEGGTVGVLADQNTSVDEGVFVNFFGIPAATTTGLVRMARHTEAAVVPGFLSWDPSVHKYRLGFGRPVEMRHSDDEAADDRENAARCNRVIEEHIRAHPDEWLWVHKRWKNRPEGDPPLYSH
jgi:Kdo2-lipid IVA lauroyltransferase/acyltransferase